MVIFGATANGSLIYQKSEIDFMDFYTYCKNYTTSGDWIIPLGTTSKYQPSDDNTKEYMHTYDTKLLNVIQRSDNNLVIKNVKMVGEDRDPRNKGLQKSILTMLEMVDKTMRKLPVGAVTFVCDKLRNVYDSVMSGPNGQQNEIHIWLPVWNVNAEKALLISILGRINFVIS